MRFEQHFAGTRFRQLGGDQLEIVIIDRAAAGMSVEQPVAGLGHAESPLNRTAKFIAARSRIRA